MVETMRPDRFDPGNCPAKMDFSIGRGADCWRCPWVRKQNRPTVCSAVTPLLTGRREAASGSLPCICRSRAPTCNSQRIGLPRTGTIDREGRHAVLRASHLMRMSGALLHRDQSPPDSQASPKFAIHRGQPLRCACPTTSRRDHRHSSRPALGRHAEAGRETSLPPIRGMVSGRQFRPASDAD